MRNKIAVLLLFIGLALAPSDLKGQSYPPVIYNNPVSRAILPSSTVRLYVEAFGTEPLNYQWYKDGMQIPDATNSAYTLLNAQTSDAGIYTVIVSNLYGFAESLPANVIIGSSALAEALDNTQLFFETGGEGAWYSQTNDFIVNRNSARGDVFLRGEQSFIETRVVGPGTLFFWWKLYADNGGELSVSVQPESAILYDNTANDLLTTFQINGYGEVGDQIILNSASVMFPLIINYFSFTYWGNNFSGNERMDVRFYLNDGVNGLPGSIIWDSGWFSIPQTSKSVVIFDKDINITLNSPTFTWAIKLNGIESNESAGLWLYSPPAIGGNYSDFWIRTNGDWELRIGQGVNMDFEAKVGVKQLNPPPIRSINGFHDWEYNYIRLQPGVNVVRWILRKNLSSERMVINGWLDGVSYIPDSSPLIIEQPVSQFGVESGMAEFFVYATGAEPLSYQWFKDGTPLLDQEGHISGANSPVLILTNLQLSDQGLYSVVISNSFGSITSSNANLTVYNASLKNLLSEAVDNTNLVFTTGGNNIWSINYDFTYDGFDSAATLGTTNPGVVWMETVVNGPGILEFYWSLVGYEGVLTLFIDTNLVSELSYPTYPEWNYVNIPIVTPGQHIVRWSYETNYSNYSFNGEHKAYIDQVRFNPPVPAISNQPQSVVSAAGDTAYFYVSAEGAQPLFYQWYKGNKPLRDDFKIQGSTNNVLVINDVQSSDIGVYYVEVKNIYGSVRSSNAYLRIYPLVGFGDNSFSQTAIPPGLTNVLAIAAGANHSLALKNDSTVIGWGWNDFGQVNVPSGLSNVISIAAGELHSLALLSDGSVVGWGDNSFGQINIPENLSNVVAIAAGGYHNLALKADGTVVAFGDNSRGQINVPENLRGVVAIDAGYAHSVALLNDGRVVSWGDYASNLNPPPQGLSNIIAIAAGNGYNLALKADGTVVSWGTYTQMPPGLSNIVSIDAGYGFSLALRSDGQLFAWENTKAGNQISPLAQFYELQNVIAFAAGGNHFLALQGDARPFFVINPKSTRQFISKKVVLSAAATGAQPIFYQWFFNGMPVPDETNNVLILENLTIDKTGNYYCVANNYSGYSTSRIANINVVAPLLPTITIQPLSTNLLVNQELKLFIQATDSQPLYYQWLKDGIALPEKTNYILTIKSVTQSDAGIYRVIVSNDFGYILSQEAIVNVFSPPYIVSQPVGYNIALGNSATLSVIAGGTEPLSYQWRKNGIPIPFATNSTLNLIAASPDAEGSYDVEILNAYGTIASRAVAITIGVPPQITVQPTNIVAVAGTTVQFSVSASGTLPLFYQWRLNDFDIPYETNAVLSIPNVTEANAGFYSVMITNRYGFALSENARLTVINPPFVVEQSEDTEVDLGKQALLFVSAIGTEPLYYQWFKDGVVLPGQTNDTFIIQSATFQDGGIYTVAVSNVAGIVTSAPIKLAIELSPEFLWARRAGGTQEDSANAIVIDRSGNVVVASQISDYIDVNGTNIQSRGNSDILIIKYSPTGDLLWARQAGGIGNDVAKAIAISDDNSIYIAGSYEKTAIFGNTNITQDGLENSGIMRADTDIFIAKYNSQGDLQWVKTIGGSGNDSINSIAVDRKGNLIVAGVYENLVVFESQTLPTVGAQDIFLAKFSPGGELFWVRSAGGFGNDRVNSVCVDDAGNIFITGAYSKGTRFGAITLESSIPPDMFLAKYDVSGNLLWVKTFIGNGVQEGISITTDPSGKIIYVGGVFGRLEGEPVTIKFGPIILNSSDGIDLFVAKFDDSGNPISARSFNYHDIDNLTSISLSPRNSVLLTGYAIDENLEEGVTLLLNENLNTLNEIVIERSKVLQGSFYAGDNNIYITGSFSNTATFGNIELTSAGGTDAFIGKIASYSAGPPIITVQPLDRQTGVGGSVRFEIGVIGTQPLYFQWFKNNQPISGANERFYEIKDASYSDEGLYYVVITNIYGSVKSREARFSIGAPPVIISQPQDISVSIEEDAYFRAQVSGTPPLFFYWYHNGLLIPYENSPTIYISEVELEHAGQYQLVVSNAAGAVTSRIATLSIKSLPTITKQPSSQQVVAGLKAEFSIEARGATPLYYQWYFNNSILPGQTNRELKLYKVNASMAGDYYAVVSNPFGSVTSQVATLIVAVPPQILIQPISQTVPLGGTAIFQVVPVDSAGVNYQWFKDEVPINGATNSTLEVQNVNFSSAGAYRVVLYNFIGGTKSEIALLKLQIPTLPLADNFEDRILTNSISGYGRANSVFATRQGGEPRHSGKRGTNSVWMSWVVPASGIATISLEGSGFDTLLAVYTGTNLSSLTPIASNDDADIRVKYSYLKFNAVAGTEYIIAIDGVGGGGEVVMQWSLESTAARLPELLIEPIDTNVQEGATITLEVASISGQAIVEWYFNNVLIASNQTQLIIENVTRDKVGIYQAILREGGRVVATRPIRLQITRVDGITDPKLSSYDKFGDALARVFENLNENNLQHSRQRIIRNQGPSRGFTGSQVFNTYGSTTDPGEPLHCGITGGASEWFIYQAPTNGLLIIDTYGSTYDTVLAVYDVAGNVPPNDFNDLRSVACNNDISPTNNLSRVEFFATAETIYYIAIDGVGGARGTAQINYNLIAPPVIVTQPQSKSVRQGTNVSFSVTASGTNLTYQWRFNSVNISGETNSTLVLTNVQSSSAGAYSVIVSNLAGTVISSNAILTVNSAPIIITNPMSLVVVQGGNASLIASASGTSPLWYQWLFNSTPISGATNNSLTLSAIQTNVSGEYNLVVTNSIGAITSSPAYLTVVTPSPQSIMTSEDTPILITLGPASTNGVVLGYVITSAPTNGVLSGTGNLRTYTPVANYSGTDSFNFAIYDGTYTSAQATITVTIIEVNDPPILNPITNVVEYEGYPISFICSGADLETPSSNLVFSLDAGAPSGAFITSSGLFLWTPSPQQAGTNVVRIVVTDTGAPPLSATQSVNIIVLPLNPVEIKHIENTTNGLVRLLIQGRMNRTNFVESTTLFTRWTVLTNLFPSSELFELLIDPSLQNRQFYRIRIDN